MDQKPYKIQATIPYNVNSYTTIKTESYIITGQHIVN